MNFQTCSSKINDFAAEIELTIPLLHHLPVNKMIKKFFICHGRSKVSKCLAAVHAINGGKSVQ